MNWLWLVCPLLPLVSCRKDQVLEGIDKNALFASPIQEDTEAVKIGQRNRDLSVKGFRAEQLIHLSENGPLLQLVSFLSRQ